MEEASVALFLAEATKHGWTNPVRAVGAQDTDEHWDWSLDHDNITSLIDVKSLKYINSTDEEPDDSLLLVELRAVRRGSNINRPGWLFGKADYICFQVKEGFWFVPRESLLKHVTETFDITVEAIRSNQNKVEHVIYYRWDYKNNESRCDKFMYLKKEEIEPLVTIKWEN